MTLRQQEPVVPRVFTKRPSVLTRRCCRLVSDQLSIRVGRAEARHGVCDYRQSLAHEDDRRIGPDLDQVIAIDRSERISFAIDATLVSSGREYLDGRAITVVATRLGLTCFWLAARIRLACQTRS